MRNATYPFHDDVAARDDLAKSLAIGGDVSWDVGALFEDDDAQVFSGCVGVALAGHEAGAFVEGEVCPCVLIVASGEGTVGLGDSQSVRECRVTKGSWGSLPH